MFRLFLIYIVYFLGLHFSCRSHKEGAHAPGGVDTSLYDLYVSFYSIGSGIDRTTKNNFDGLIAHLERESGQKLQIVRSSWGWEGEIDYCIRLKGISSPMKEEFLLRARKILGAGEHLLFAENATCRKKPD
jgi:hypothetical protein